MTLLWGEFEEIHKGQARFRSQDGNLRGPSKLAAGLDPGTPVAIWVEDNKVVKVSKDPADVALAQRTADRVTSDKPSGPEMERPRASKGRVQRTRPRTVAGSNGFVNPYTFVPLPARDPQRRPLIPHDRFVELSGTLTVRVEALTPLFTTAFRPEAGAGDAAPLPFLEVRGRHAINATTLKGLIRSTAELVSGSCLRIIESNRRFSHRPPVSAKDPDTMALQHPYRVIELTAHRLVLKPLDFATLRIRDSRNEWRYHDLSEKCDGDRVRFTVSRDKYRNIAELTDRTNTQSHEGQLKLSDIRGEDPGKSRLWRKNQLVVWEKKGAGEIELKGDEARGLIDAYNQAIEASIMEDERVAGGSELIWCAALHEASNRAGTVKRWGARRKRHHLEVGDVVFGDQDHKGRLSVIGPSQITRRVFRKGAADAIPAGFLPCTDPEQLCWACRLFGMTADEAGNDLGGVAGHVRIGWAFADRDTKPVLFHLPVLGSPKPSHGPFYLLPKSDGSGATWNDDRVEIAGRKLYWHQSKVASRPDAQRKELAADVLALPKGATFTFTVRFDNLSKADLGLLVCSIDPRWLGEGFGAAAHKIGMGRPVGLGSVRLSIISATQIDRHARYRDLRSESSPIDIDPCVAEFVARLEEEQGAKVSELEYLQAFAAATDFETGCKLNVIYPPGPPGSEHESHRWFSKNSGEALLWPEQVRGGARQTR